MRHVGVLFVRCRRGIIRIHGPDESQVSEEYDAPTCTTCRVCHGSNHRRSL